MLCNITVVQLNDLANITMESYNLRTNLNNSPYNTFLCLLLEMLKSSLNGKIGVRQIRNTGYLCGFLCSRSAVYVPWGRAWRLTDLGKIKQTEIR